MCFFFLTTSLVHEDRCTRLLKYICVSEEARRLEPDKHIKASTFLCFLFRVETKSQTELLPFNNLSNKYVFIPTICQALL